MIKEFQIKFKLEPDGIMGPNTARVLKSYLGIRRNEKAAHFLGQCHHESAGFTAISENLNYSEAGLLNVFGKYFTKNVLTYPHKKLASLYARRPKAIANLVYANRMGNGNEASGDGWKHRGQGPLQLTGKNNHQAFANYVDDQSIMDDPSLISSKYYFASALFFFMENHLWGLCDEVHNNNIIMLTKKINGGTNGLQDRIAYTNKYYKWLTN